MIRKKLYVCLPYLESLTIVLGMVALFKPLSDLVQDHVWLFLLEIGTCYSVWRGGPALGVFSLLLSTLSSIIFFLPIRIPMAAESRDNAVSLSIFLILGAIIIAFGNALRSEHRRVLEREQELVLARNKLAEANLQLSKALEKKTSDLQEIREYLADEI